jgi:hypothetical protein
MASLSIPFYSFFGQNLFDDFKKSQLTETGVDSGRTINTKDINNFETFSEKYKHTLIQPMDQEL